MRNHDYASYSYEWAVYLLQSSKYGNIGVYRTSALAFTAAAALAKSEPLVWVEDRAALDGNITYVAQDDDNNTWTIRELDWYPGQDTDAGRRRG